MSLGTGLAPAQAPAPAATAIPEIAHVRSSPFCSALRENVGHAIGGILANDALVAASKPVFMKMGHDFSMDVHGASLHLDMSRMEEISGSLLHNLKVIDALLGDPARFPKAPKTADERALVSMRDDLAKVASAQRKALNLVEGVVDTYGMEEMNGRGDGLHGALGKDLSRGDSSSLFTTGSNSAAGYAPSPADQHNPEFNLPPSFLNNAFGRFYLAVAANQAETAPLEAAVARTVIANTPLCK